MDILFLVKLALSVLVGGLWVAATTSIGERLGGKAGGLIGGLPSTVLVSYAFIGWTQGSEPAFAATTVFPVTYTIGALCTFVYVVAPARRLTVRIVSYALLWLLLQALVVVSGFYDYATALLLWLLFVVFLINFTARYGTSIAATAGTGPPASVGMLTRAVLSGAIIGVAVLLSRFGGPTLASIFAAFPGVYVSTLLIADRSAGVGFARALLTPMMLSGSINCVVYVVVFRSLVLNVGTAIATAAAIGSVVLSGYASHLLLRRLIRVPSASGKS